MSWKAASMPDLRKAFMERLAHDEHTSLSTLCREFGVSRTTAYKWQSRYDPDDAASLHDQMQDRSRAPRNHPNATSQAVEEGLLRVRRAHPTWGPRKIIAYLSKKDPDQPCPAASTVGQILKTNGLVPARTKKRLHPDGPRPLWKDGPFNAPNALWTIDFKGQFQTLDGQWCYPLTLMDYHSRYLLCGQAFARIDGEDVQRVMEAAFREYGLPLAIKSDNGPPFGAPGVARLSRLGVWWLRLGVQLYPNRPASPQDNAAHERFHRTLLADTATPPQATRRCQQRAFLAYGAVYNNERPHEALDMRTPSDVYIPSHASHASHASPRPFPERLPDVPVPDDALPRYVFPNGCLRVNGKEVFLSQNVPKPRQAVRRLLPCQRALVRRLLRPAPLERLRREQDRLGVQEGSRGRPGRLRQDTWNSLAKRPISPAGGPGHFLLGGPNEPVMNQRAFIATVHHVPQSELFTISPLVQGGCRKTGRCE